MNTSSAVQSVERTDPNSRLAHRQLLEKARTGRIDVYFLGDSIARRWGATDYPQFLAHWKKTFFGWNAGNFGWGGDTVENMLWRITHGELDGVNPKVIVILAGTNNLGQGPCDDAKVARVVNGVRALLAVCEEKAPRAAIVLMGVLPRNDREGAMPAIRQINAQLATFADGKRIRYLDIGEKLASGDGMLLAGVSVDKLHLTLKGYEIWGEALKPMLTELIGPPAEKDEAPPPTGDPSAKKR